VGVSTTEGRVGGNEGISRLLFLTLPRAAIIFLSFPFVLKSARLTASSLPPSLPLPQHHQVSHPRRRLERRPLSASHGPRRAHAQREVLQTQQTLSFPPSLPPSHPPSHSIIRYLTPDEGANAVRSLHRTVLDGRTLNVRFYKPNKTVGDGDHANSGFPPAYAVAPLGGDRGGREVGGGGGVEGVGGGWGG